MTNLSMSIKKCMIFKYIWYNKKDNMVLLYETAEKVGMGVYYDTDNQKTTSKKNIICFNLTAN